MLRPAIDAARRVGQQIDRQPSIQIWAEGKRDVQLASEDAMGDVLCSEAMKMGNQLGALSPQGAESGNQKRIDDGARAEQEHRSGQFARGDAADSVVDAANAVA